MINSEILKKLRVITDEEKSFLNGGINIDRNIYMENKNSVVSSKKMLSNGKLIAMRPHTRYVRFPKHTHDFVEIIYMCSGVTTHIVDGNTIELKEGELLFLSQSSTQEVMPAGTDDIAVNFIVSPVFFNNVLQMIGQEDTPIRRFLIDCLTNSKNGSGYLHFEVSDILPIQNLVENLICTLVYNTPNKRNINQITMGLLFLQLINHIDRLAYGSEEESIAFKVLAYIEENYSSGSLNELADTLHYDISALSRNIKKETGRTYTELVCEKRLSQALFLLKNTDIKVDEIAYAIGYTNVSFFYRTFKKHYGLSPFQYRKSCK